MNKINSRLVNFDVIYEKINRKHAHVEGITVAVSLFNYEKFVAECLDSIHAQIHKYIEIIVIDDCSTKDDSVGAVKKWMEIHNNRFARASLIKHSRNQGLAEARNTAFDYSRTDLVFVIDADNMIYPRALGRLYDVMRNREFDAAYTQHEHFGDVTRLGHSEVWNKRHFVHGNYVDAMALISKRSWAQVQGYTHMEGDGKIMISGASSLTLV
ncbi:glycosyltransferase family 2 protein [Candidatus Pantoea bituminis]|uniref:glycosyltransferase family 2 protein n=1 Tax=Candidatus Pantoea bituminis TaxID=2831036 RepID=UPI001C062094|nr:glycosyltransferase family 2 protein [Pantoea bituminis]